MEVYPHNIIYEFLVDFGKPLGYFLLFAVLLLLLAGLFKTKGKLAFFYSSFVAASISLLWSGSYLSTPSFWMAIFIAVFILDDPSINRVGNRLQYEKGYRR